MPDLIFSKEMLKIIITTKLMKLKKYNDFFFSYNQIYKRLIILREKI